MDADAATPDQATAVHAFEVQRLERNKSPRSILSLKVATRYMWGYWKTIAGWRQLREHHRDLLTEFEAIAAAEAV